MLALTHAARSLTLLACAALALSWAACDGAADQRGALGEFCYSDADCRPSLVCEQNLCLSNLDDGDNSDNGDNGEDNNLFPSNNGGNNDPGNNSGPSNNGSSNSTTPSPYGCAEACVQLVGCNFTEEQSSCTQECIDAQSRGPERAWARIFECIQASSCDQLDACFPNEDSVPRERLQACQDLSDLTSACGGDPDLWLQVCSLLALTDNEEQFARAQECNVFSSCTAVLGCLEDWAGLARGALSSDRP